MMFSIILYYFTEDTRYSIAVTAEKTVLDFFVEIGHEILSHGHIKGSLITPNDVIKFSILY